MVYPHVPHPYLPTLHPHPTFPPLPPPPPLPPLPPRVLLNLAVTPESEWSLPANFVDAFRSTLTDEAAEPSLLAYALTLPDYSTLSQEMPPPSPP